MEENNQNIQVEQNNLNNENNIELQSLEVKKRCAKKWPKVLFTILYLALVGVLSLYFALSSNLEEVEVLVLIVSLLISIGYDILSSILFTRWPNVLLTIFCLALVSVSVLYLVQSLNFEGLEGLALVFTLPVILGSNILASIISIINFIIATRETKAQKIFALILMIFVLVYSIFSIALLFTLNKNNG